MNKENLGSKTKELWKNPEYRERMKNAHVGKTPWNKGIKTGIVPKSAFKKGQISPRKGVVLSPYTLEKMSRSLRGRTMLNTRGELNWNWKGGTTPLQDKIRKCFTYRQWRSDVFFRDNFTCQECDTRGGKIQAHHIKPFVVILRENDVKSVDEALSCEELWDINNGLTLCIKCHEKTDTYGGNKK